MRLTSITFYYLLFIVFSFVGNEIFTIQDLGTEVRTCGLNSLFTGNSCSDIEAWFNLIKYSVACIMVILFYNHLIHLREYTIIHQMVWLIPCTILYFQLLFGRELVNYVLTSSFRLAPLNNFTVYSIILSLISECIMLLYVSFKMHLSY